ncbi:winged helix-turn-helix domain-containing protein [Amycolatopsis halotolerans]|uniref:Winged helix-turn-helix domain-containing protein n=1 Tax=Amycolatopsis halotolerans TaxID=330083 RepID=A0ABV7QXG2_9PSEU
MPSKHHDRQIDARALRALAHPLRMELLDLLTIDGPATATGLGKRVGESSGTTSWHLRQLADAGLVVEDAERGSKRERWWKAAQQGTSLKTSEFLEDPDLAGPVTAFLHHVVNQRYRETLRFVADLPRWGKTWQRNSTLSDTGLQLTAEEAGQLSKQIQELIESYRRETRPGDTTVFAQWSVFPYSPRPEAEEQD